MAIRKKTHDYKLIKVNGYNANKSYIYGHTFPDGKKVTIGIDSKVKTDIVGYLSDENDSSLLIYERHIAGSSTTRPYQPASANGQVSAMQIECHDIVGFGWWSRNLIGSQQAQLNLSMMCIRFPDEGHLQGFIKLSQNHAAYCWEAEPDTVIYSAGIVTSYSESDLDIESGDIIFIMGCTDEAAVQKHLEDPKHVALGYQLYDADIRLTPTLTKSYKTCGDGFFYKPST